MYYWHGHRYHSSVFFTPWYEKEEAEKKQAIASLNKLFLHDELCKNWLRGCCNKTNCRWVHGNHDDVKEAVMHFDRPYKSKVCEEFRKSKVCPHGPNGRACWYVHDDPKNTKCELDKMYGICFSELGTTCPYLHFDGYDWE